MKYRSLVPAKFLIWNLLRFKESISDSAIGENSVEFSWNVSFEFSWWVSNGMVGGIEVPVFVIMLLFDTKSLCELILLTSYQTSYECNLSFFAISCWNCLVSLGVRRMF